MALKLKADPTFWTTVKVPMPGGATTDIKVEFFHMTRDQLKAFQDSKDDINDAKTLLRIVKDWKEVDGELNEETLKEFLQNYHGAGMAIARSFVSELMQVRLGN